MSFEDSAGRLVVAGVAALMLAGCGTTTVATNTAGEVPAEAYVDTADGFTTIEDEAVALAAGAVWFDGSSWKRMDPTFASTANRSPDIMAYIGGDQNYSAKYFY